MNPAQVSRFLAAGATRFAQVFPATIRIDGQSYSAGTAPFTHGMQLADGGAEAVQGIAFLLPVASFAAAGQPEPVPLSSVVECTAPAHLAGTYTLESIAHDPAGTNISLRCRALAQ